MRHRVIKSLARPAIAILTLAAFGCGADQPVSPSEVRITWQATLPEAPDDTAWRQTPVHVASLLLQDMVEPRLMQVSTREARVQAVTDGAHVAIRLEWIDPSADDLPGISRFSDACAVQMPQSSGPDVPAPQMGETGKTVEIAYWSAAWQAAAAGRPDNIKELYPGATVDHYPFEAPSLEPDSAAQQELESAYSPARALGNNLGLTRSRAVQDLLADGPGTLRPAPETVSEGRGMRTADGWAVVIRRPLPRYLTPGNLSQIAVAIWQGSNDEVGARKMRSGWIPLHLEERHADS